MKNTLSPSSQLQIPTLSVTEGAVNLSELQENCLPPPQMEKKVFFNAYTLYNR